MARKITRKCKICKNEFDIVSNKYIKINGSFLEVNCYKKQELSKGLSEECVDKTIQILFQKLQLEQEEKEKEHLEKEKAKMKSKMLENNRVEYRNQFYKYISEEYNIKVIPKYIYKKVATINNGTYKGLSIGIPYEDLLDMFKRKQNFLNKTYDKKASKGETMTQIQRINYDLAVIINKYDDYLKWKHQQEILQHNIQKEIEMENSDIKIDYSKIKANTKRDDNEADICDIINDLY